MKKKAFIFLLLVPFIVAILAFVSASYVIRLSEVYISGVNWKYELNQAFMIKDGRQKLECDPIYDERYPLNEKNTIVWSSSDPSIASIEKEGEDSYLVPLKAGRTTITCTNEANSFFKEFVAIIVDDGGAIVINPIIPFSSSSISGVNYVGLYDTTERYDAKDSAFVTPDAYLDLNIELLGPITMSDIKIEASENVSFDSSLNRVNFLKEGEAYLRFNNPLSEAGSGEISFTLIDALNVYDYDDLINFTNKSSKPYKLVLRSNLESLRNTYNLDTDGKILDKKSKDTNLFGRLDENNELLPFEEDIFTFETTYNHEFLTNYNKEIDEGKHPENEKTNVNIKSGIHIKDDFYGNGFVINAHELTYPSGTQTITVNGETMVIPYLMKDDLFRGPIPFVTLGNPNFSSSEVYPMFTLYGQDNSAFYIDSDNVTLRDVHFKNCDFGNNLTNLEYVGSTLDINADNVRIFDSILENGRNVLRAYSSKNLIVENSLLQNSMEFLFRSGSNEFNHVNYDENVVYYGENGKRLSTSKSSYLAPISSQKELLEKNYKADTVLTFGTISNTQTDVFLSLPESQYTKEDYINTKEIIADALTNETGMYLEDGSKNYVGTTTLKDVLFSNSGISAISLDALPQGTFLETNITSIFGMLLTQYMDGVTIKNLALTGYPTLVNVTGDTRFYDWKNTSNLTFESLVGQDIRSLIEAHGGLGSDFEVQITEDDYLPLKKMLLDNHSDEIIHEERLNLPVYIAGGGYNTNDIIFDETISQKLTSEFTLDPFVYSLDLKAYESDHFMSDPLAKYETMKVAMLRGASNVIGLNEYKMYAIKNDDLSWYNEIPSLDTLRTKATQ